MIALAERMRAVAERLTLAVRLGPALALLLADRGRLEPAADRGRATELAAAKAIARRELADLRPRPLSAGYLVA